MTTDACWYDLGRPTLPRLAPTVIRRPRIDAWLDRHAAVPLCFIAAPSGSGKTTALASYLAQTDSRAVYIDAPVNIAAPELRERIARALGIHAAPESYNALLTVLEACAPCEVAIDSVDNASPEAIRELCTLVEDAPPGVSLLYAVCDRSAIDLRRHLLRGLAVLLDADTLAFDADETARLASRQGVSCTPADVAALLVESEGWAIVVDGVVRDASERRATLDGAYEAWCATRGRHFTSFIAFEMRKAANDGRRAFELAAKGLGGRDDDGHLAQLEARGLFVRYDASAGFRPYRVAARFAATEVARAASEQPAVAPLRVRLFARFDARIEERAIEWVRRRDKALFAYVVLQPEGRATRKAVREAFWPDADEHLATQSIRTACSNIRKAIAQIVGSDAVDRYFSSATDLVVNLQHVELDVLRFKELVTNGDREFEHGNVSEALAHYCAAKALYVGDFLSAEFPEAWHGGSARELRALHSHTVERLARLRTLAAGPAPRPPEQSPPAKLSFVSLER